MVTLAVVLFLLLLVFFSNYFLSQLNIIKQLNDISDLDNIGLQKRIKSYLKSYNLEDHEDHDNFYDKEEDDEVFNVRERANQQTVEIEMV